MTRIFIPALVAVSVVISGSAWAIDNRGDFVSRFNYSCKQLEEFHKNAGLEKDGSGVTFNRSFSVIIGWMAGYISRVNQREAGKADFFGNLGDEAIWLLEWCKINPGGDLAEAMDALTRERTSKPEKTSAATAVKPAATPAKAAAPAPKK